MSKSEPRDSDREQVADKAGINQAKAGPDVKTVVVGVDAPGVTDRLQCDGDKFVEHEARAPLNFGEDLSERRRYKLDLVVDDFDQNNMVVAVSRDRRHVELLSDGWYPVRWRHPELGDLEMVVSDRFWVFRRKANDGGVVIGPASAVDAALADGRGKFVRDPDGNLIAVSLKDGDR